MILNLRPTKPENLNTIVEEMEGRFPGEELQLEICEIITEVLGKPDGEAERHAMSENAIEARKEVERQGDENARPDRSPSPHESATAAEVCIDVSKDGDVRTTFFCFWHYNAIRSDYLFAPACIRSHRSRGCCSLSGNSNG